MASAGVGPSATAVRDAGLERRERGRGVRGFSSPSMTATMDEAHAVVEAERGVVQAVGLLLGELGEDVADQPLVLVGVSGLVR